ncbi:MULTISPECIES: DMT family transporter [unclassified Clostridium]|uniref:DMT family transporter n=2 Tax=Clostridium TaxID=1485 RepID=UPI002A81C45B|nr:DMT family transporter [Clostridium sp.]MDY4251026.1 DMT family transporter [Clostridium sp.]
MKQLKSPRLMLVASMIIFGTLGPFVRNISVSSGELALYRAILAALLIAIFLIITKQKIPFKNIKKKKEVPLLLASGVAMGINWILLFQAYKYTTVSAATLSYYFAPVIVTIVCPILFHEKLTKKQIICFIMSTLGLVMITGIGNIGGRSDFIGILFGLGVVIISVTILGETMTLWQIIGGILILGFTLWNEITPKEYFR